MVKNSSVRGPAKMSVTTRLLKYPVFLFLSVVFIILLLALFVGGLLNKSNIVKSQAAATTSISGHVSTDYSLFSRKVDRIRVNLWEHKDGERKLKSWTEFKNPLNNTNYHYLFKKLKQGASYDVDIETYLHMAAKIKDSGVYDIYPAGFTEVTACQGSTQGIIKDYDNDSVCTITPSNKQTNQVDFISHARDIDEVAGKISLPVVDHPYELVVDLDEINEGWHSYKGDSQYTFEIQPGTKEVAYSFIGLNPKRSYRISPFVVSAPEQNVINGKQYYTSCQNSLASYFDGRITGFFYKPHTKTAYCEISDQPADAKKPTPTPQAQSREITGYISTGFNGKVPVDYIEVAVNKITSEWGFMREQTIKLEGLKFYANPFEFNIDPKFQYEVSVYGVRDIDGKHIRLGKLDANMCVIKDLRDGKKGCVINPGTDDQAIEFSLDFNQDSIIKGTIYSDVKTDSPYQVTINYDLPLADGGIAVNDKKVILVNPGIKEIPYQIDVVGLDPFWEHLVYVNVGSAGKEEISAIEGKEYVAVCNNPTKLRCTDCFTTASSVVDFHIYTKDEVPVCPMSSSQNPIITGQPAPTLTPTPTLANGRITGKVTGNLDTETDNNIYFRVGLCPSGSNLNKDCFNGNSMMVKYGDMFTIENYKSGIWVYAIDGIVYARMGDNYYVPRGTLGTNRMVDITKCPAKTVSSGLNTNPAAYYGCPMSINAGNILNMDFVIRDRVPQEDNTN